MPIFPFEGRVPKVHPTAFIAPNAILIGAVEVGENASVWYGAVLRGDIEPVIVGARSNIQDCAVLHTESGYPCVIKEDVTVGHVACVHGAVLENGVLVGMNATVLTRAVVGRDAIIAAQALIPEGAKVADRSLMVGVPAKRLREVTEEEIARFRAGCERYVRNGQRHRAALDEWFQANGIRL